MPVFKFNQTTRVHHVNFMCLQSQIQCQILILFLHAYMFRTIYAIISNNNTLWRKTSHHNNKYILGKLLYHFPKKYKKTYIQWVSFAIYKSSYTPNPCNVGRERTFWTQIYMTFSVLKMSTPSNFSLCQAK